MLNKRIILVLFLIFSAVYLSAQGKEAVVASESLIRPVFPESSAGLVYIEGEDAVSTNFANQAVSNFGCSGYRAVQLSRTIGLQGGAAFYADFVFYIEEAGEYEFWYGGTPPGPLDELSPSYASPFSYRLDDGDLVDLYREDVSVVEGYSPSYYWNKCNVINLTEGAHKIRIEVSKKRGFDGRYYFYLDSLFFLNKDRLDEIEELKPSVFPSVLEGSAIDNPFLSINDYQSYINSHPDDMSAYIELSFVFSLLGDYQAALKTLSRAMALDAADPYPILLAAKNRLWKGDVRESLALYERALTVDPENRMLWAEAGKVAAWTAEYDKSIAFFTRGLDRFPDDGNMRVNLGLTYLWMARDLEAQEAFASAFEQASDDPKKLAELGWIEEAAGYQEYARDVYTQSIELYPEYLEFYLLLQSSFLSSGNRESADNVGRMIESTFISSDQLQNELEIYQRRLYLRDEVINSYLARLRENPGNLELRQELAQTFFWNGMSTEAIEQIKYVITTYSYRAAETFVRRNSELLVLTDETASIIPFFENFGESSAAVRRKITAAAGGLSRAQKAVASSEGAEAEEIAAARAQLGIAEQAFADAVAEAQYLAGLMENFSSNADSYEQQINIILDAEKAENEAFLAMTGSSGWRWAKSWQIDELSEIMKKERVLASFMLGRVLISNSQHVLAAEVLMPEAEQGSIIIETAADAVEATDAAFGGSMPDLSAFEAVRLYSLYQALLHSGDTGFDPDSRRLSLLQAEKTRLAAAYPHIDTIEDYLGLSSELAGTSEDLRWYSPPSGVFFEGLAEESAEYIKILTDYEKDISRILRKASGLLGRLEAVAEKELERDNYYLEADTYLIRYELGNYYLEEGRNIEASEQFRRVIAVDPWNISATYKLGIVEQRYGNWSEAMKYYKKVYQQDSSYENSLYYYNQLARSHADKFSSSVQLINTPSKMSLSGKLGYSAEFNSLFGFGINYTLDQQRLYREFPGEEKGSFQVHLVEASLPLTFNIIGLTITPKVGIYTESIYYKTDPFIPDGDRVSIQEFLGTISTYPKFGAKALWSKDFLTLDAGWANMIEAETFYADREIIRKNDIELNINTWFDFDEDFLGPLTTRTYGRLQVMGDSNLKGQVYQDAMLGLNLMSNPVIRLSPSVSFNYENSKTVPGEGYYAPRNVIEAKGGLRSSFTFPSSDWSRALEAVLWAAGGGFWSNLGEDSAAGSVKAEGGLGVTWVKNSNVYQLNISGLGTFTAEGNDYWELGIAIGSTLALPGLLAP